MVIIYTNIDRDRDREKMKMNFGRKLYNKTVRFMKKNMRFVSGFVLASRYAFGDITCQYYQLNTELAEERAANIRPRTKEEEEAVVMEASTSLSSNESLNSSNRGGVTRGVDHSDFSLLDLLGGFLSTTSVELPAECENESPLFNKQLEDSVCDDVATGLMSFSEFLKRWDKRRTLAFLTFGIFYFGIPGPGHVVYTRVLPTVFGPKKPLQAAIFDAGVVTPLIYMSSFYVVMKAWSDEFLGYYFKKMFDDHYDDDGLKKRISLAEVVSSGLDTWRENFIEDAKLCCAVWIPFHYCNFAVFPVFMRTTVLAIQGLAWVALLSAVRGEDTLEDDCVENTKYVVKSPISWHEMSGGELHTEMI